ncbi:MAG TPA: OmpA family protein [Kofleriaceae bacterium]|nr:OmpA family protein [Kofleriaceae bacterium]
MPRLFAGIVFGLLATTSLAYAGPDDLEPSGPATPNTPKQAPAPGVPANPDDLATPDASGGTTKTKSDVPTNPDDLASPDAAATATTTVAPVDEGPPPTPIEVGAFGGGFITNFYHQFYELSKFEGNPAGPMTRPLQQKVSPLFGLRVAYFIKPWLGVEGELNLMLNHTKDLPGDTVHGSAQIYSGHIQLIFQYPDLSPYVIPFVTFGDGFMHTSSSAFGTDTDWPLNTDVGARFLVHRSVTIRAEGRFLRGPSAKDPYTLDASYAEFMFGVSWRPSKAPPEPPPPPPPPKVDSDGDAIFDDLDKCPNQAEDTDMFDDTDGCPDPDNDLDGIFDGSDKCPLDPEDKDGNADDDGCPDLDDDLDGVPDKQDKCLREPEDKDGYQDLDGCPDPDNDKDGIPDAKDTCPNEPEVINGTDDEDGCPDRGNALVVISPDRLEIMESVIFKKTIIQKDSFNLLDQVGAQLRVHPEILRVRVTVHVQPTKDPDADQRLSETRAFAVREYLIKYGIDEKRLEPRGFGGTKPLVDPKSKGAKDVNDRLELIILERK